MSHHPSGAEALRAWREGASKTQTGLARDLDVRPNTVCEWERDTRRPDILNALRLEGISGGKVPAALWGHDPEECARVLTAMTNVALRRPGASDAAPADDLATADTLPPVAP